MPVFWNEIPEQPIALVSCAMKTAEKNSYRFPRQNRSETHHRLHFPNHLRRGRNHHVPILSLHEWIHHLPDGLFQCNRNLKRRLTNLWPLPELGALIQKHILRSHHHHCIKLIGQSPIGAELIQFDETFRFIQALNASAAANPCVRVSTGPVIGSPSQSLRVTRTD